MKVTKLLSAIRKESISIQGLIAVGLAAIVLIHVGYIGVPEQRETVLSTIAISLMLYGSAMFHIASVESYARELIENNTSNLAKK